MARFRLPRPRRDRAERRPPPVIRWFVRERSAPDTAPSTPSTAPSTPSTTPESQPEPPPEHGWGDAGLRSAGAALGGAAAWVGRVPVAVGRGAKRFWLSMSVSTRQRLAAAVGALVVLLVIAFVVVPVLPCGAPGGDKCPPGDDAIQLVPDDALGYLHANADPDTTQYQDAREVADRIPIIAEQLTDRLVSRVPGPHGQRPDFARDIEPWFGGQAALAVVPAGEQAAEEVQLLQVKDEDGARKYTESVATGTPDTTDYRDIPVSVDSRGLATAIVGGFLAIGRESGVRDVIDAQSGASGTGSLADDPNARAARDALPDDRLADAYLSADGIEKLVDNPRGSLATLDAAVDPTASTGVAMAAVASDDGIELDIRSELDEARAKAQPGFLAAFPAFEPTLVGSLPADSLAYVGIADPGHTLVSLIGQASADQPGLAAAVGSLVKRVKDLGKVDLEADLLPSLGGEAAFALQPAPAETGGGQLEQSSGVPYLEFLSSGVDPERAGRALASLQGPIAEALSPSGGQAPTFSQSKVGGVTAHSVRLSPTVNLTYAIAGSVLLIATDPAAVGQLAGEGGGLADDDAFNEATGGLPGSVALLSYFNLTGLIALGEQAGLAQDPAYETFAREIHKLRSLALSVQQSPTELATDVRLIVTPEAPTPSQSSEQGTVPKD